MLSELFAALETRMTQLEGRMTALEGRMTMLMWMVGLNLALTLCHPLPIVGQGALQALLNID
jgi:hypothetical protein